MQGGTPEQTGSLDGARMAPFVVRWPSAAGVDVDATAALHHEPNDQGRGATSRSVGKGRDWVRPRLGASAWPRPETLRPGPTRTGQWRGPRALSVRPTDEQGAPRRSATRSPGATHGCRTQSHALVVLAPAAQRGTTMGTMSGSPVDLGAAVGPSPPSKQQDFKAAGGSMPCRSVHRTRMHLDATAPIRRVDHATAGQARQ
jgi:hypothetical protein